jgi:hypothetical protein
VVPYGFLLASCEPKKPAEKRGKKLGEDDDDAAVYLKEHMKCFSIM